MRDNVVVLIKLTIYYIPLNSSLYWINHTSYYRAGTCGCYLIIGFYLINNGSWYFLFRSFQLSSATSFRSALFLAGMKTGQYYALNPLYLWSHLLFAIHHLGLVEEKTIVKNIALWFQYPCKFGQGQGMKMSPLLNADSDSCQYYSFSFR